MARTPQVPQYTLSRLAELYRKSRTSSSSDLIVQGGESGRAMVEAFLKSPDLNMIELNAPDGSQYWVLGIHGWDFDGPIGPE